MSCGTESSTTLSG